MMRGWILLVFLVAISFAQAEPPVRLPDKLEADAVDRYIAKQVATRGFVGLSVAIIRDGKPVLVKAYGKTALDGMPATTETPFAIGSVTKQFACACAFMLADEGKLAISDPVSKWYPELTRAKDITLHDLMSHVSGYPDYYPLDFLDRRMKRPIELDQLLKEYGGGPLDFEPRSRWSYSNTGYILLGRIVEKVSGKPLPEFMKERIFTPLGMTSAVLDPVETTNLARGATTVMLGPLEAIPTESRGWLHAAGGLYCCAGDLAKWDVALMEGKLLKPESHRLMRQARELSNGKVRDYGCGLSIARMSGELVLGHGGAVSGFLAENAFVPRTHSAVVVLSNAEQVDLSGLHRELLGLVVADADKAQMQIPQVQGPPPREIARTIFKQLQQGKVDRTQLGEEFNLYLTEERVKEAAPRLAAYGEPTSVELASHSERGGMETARLRFTFKTGTVRINMFRSKDGKIQQFLLTK